MTLKSKADANAGTGAASGVGNPVPGQVGRVEVAAGSLPRKAVLGESGLSRTRRKPSGVSGEGPDRLPHSAARNLHGKAVVTRLRGAGVMTR